MYNMLQTSPALFTVLHCEKGFKQCVKCKQVHCGCQLCHGHCVQCIMQIDREKRSKISNTEMNSVPIPTSFC